MIPEVAIRTRLPTAAPSGGGRLLFVPALDRFPPPLRELMGLLPVCDVNGELLAALTTPVAAGLRSMVVAGVFAADPFLDVRELVRVLARAGVERVANYPTVQMLEGATAAELGAVGYHAGQEFARLQAIAAEGLQVAAYVTSAEAARAALDGGIRSLILRCPAAADGAFAASVLAQATAAGADLARHTVPAEGPFRDGPTR